MKKGDLVMVRSDIPSGVRVGGVLFTEKYHVPLRNEIFTLKKQTSNGNWYYEKGDTSVVFSESMLINLTVIDSIKVSSVNDNSVTYRIDSSDSNIAFNTNEAILTNNLITNKEYENRLQGEETSHPGRDSGKGSTIYGRRNEATIAIRHLSYKARYGKS